MRTMEGSCGGATNSIIIQKGANLVSCMLIPAFVQFADSHTDPTGSLGIICYAGSYRSLKGLGAQADIASLGRQIYWRSVRDCVAKLVLRRIQPWR